MAKAFRAYIFASFLCSAIAGLLLIVSFATSSWVVGEAEPQLKESTDTKASQVNYGLFMGTLERSLFNNQPVYEIYMTCLFSEGICALSCLLNSDDREEEIKRIQNEEEPGFHCDSIKKMYEPHHKLDKGTFNSPGMDLTFIDPGIWVSTLFFLAAGVALSSACSALAVYNTATNPIQPLFNILGLYIFNAAAASVDLIALIIWGVHFATNISKNLAIRDTLVGEYDSSGMSHLGYSYWIILPAAVLHLGAIGALMYRQHLLEKEPPEPKIDFDSDGNADGRIFLF